jgi:hypothetical protein
VRRRREKEKKRKGREIKEKNKKYMKFFPNLKIFMEKKKTIYKAGKNYFCTRME